MQPSSVQSLLDAVRRRLWREQLSSAARSALWASAALMLVAAAGQVVVGPLGVQSVLPTVAALWVVAMLWAGSRRPASAACALWADRNLAGESAYSTLVEARATRSATPDAQALQWLEQWAAAAVPRSERLLATRLTPARVIRPLVTALVCTALAAIVMTLPSPGMRMDGKAVSPAAPQSSTRADSAAAPLAEPAATAELAAALRRAQPRSDRDRGNMVAVPAPAGHVDGSRTAPRGADRGPTPAAVQTQSADAAGGRKAGDSRDDRTDRGKSQASQEPMMVQRQALAGRSSTTDRRVDMDKLATFDDERTTTGALTERAPESVIESPGAAAPPPAVGSLDLTPAQAAYVQAWLVTSRGRQ